MNEATINFMRETLKDQLSLCSEGQISMFKRMYSHENVELSICEAIDNMPEEKLDIAMQQVERTLHK